MSHICDLPVPVLVDAPTGTWSVDGQPMVLLPRHFWVGVQQQVEQAIGVERFRQILFDASYDAARLWCAREAKFHHLAGPALFEHYARRMGQRGIAQIRIERFDAETGAADIRVDHSVYVAEYGNQAGRKTCYMLEGAFAGGIETAFATLGKTVACRAEEVQCAAEGAPHCRFHVGGP